MRETLTTVWWVEECSALRNEHLTKVLFIHAVCTLLTSSPVWCKKNSSSLASLYWYGFKTYHNGIFEVVGWILFSVRFVLKEYLWSVSYKISLPVIWKEAAIRDAFVCTSSPYFLEMGQSLLSMVLELKKRRTSVLYKMKMIAQKLEEQLIQGVFSTRLKDVLSGSSYLVLRRKDKATRRATASIRASTDEFTQGIEKKSGGFKSHCSWILIALFLLIYYYRH